MPDTLSFAILGVVQGLTEFLPVSSTGHLILVRDIFNLTTERALAVDAVLHLATALAVLVYFRRDILRLTVSFFDLVCGRSSEREDRILIYALLLGTVPAVLVGLALEGTIEGAFRNPDLVAYTLIAGSVLFFVAERLAKQNAALSVPKGLAIGFFQALALVPGISRSGATISGGLLLGLTREQSARFAFLLSFPIIIGAGTLKFVELGAAGFIFTEATPLLAGAFAAFVSGILAIHFLITFLKKHTLDIFIVYRLALAALILMIL